MIIRGGNNSGRRDLRAPSLTVAAAASLHIETADVFICQPPPNMTNRRSLTTDAADTLDLFASTDTFANSGNPDQQRRPRRRGTMTNTGTEHQQRVGRRRSWAQSGGNVSGDTVERQNGTFSDNGGDHTGLLRAGRQRPITAGTTVATGETLSIGEAANQAGSGPPRPAR